MLNATDLPPLLCKSAGLYYWTAGDAQNGSVAIGAASWQSFPLPFLRGGGEMPFLHDSSRGRGPASGVVEGDSDLTPGLPSALLHASSLNFHILCHLH